MISTRLFAVGFAGLGLAMPAFGQEPLPQGKAFAVSFEKAIACATEMANQSSFDRDKLDSIPREVLEHCAKERDSAIQELNTANPNPDPSIPRNWVAAKMRMAAQERLINRLEGGETPKADNDSGLGLEAVAARYILCARLAINHKLEGIHFGQDWTSEIGGIPEDQIEGYFISIGRTSCPMSFQSYTNGLDNALRSSDSGLKKVILDGWDTREIDKLAVGAYVRMASSFRKKKP